MPDEADSAQPMEALHLQAAIFAAGVRPVDHVDGPVMIDGVACCVDCERPIPLARLQAVPDASRCVRCQEDVDGLAA